MCEGSKSRVVYQFFLGGMRHGWRWEAFFDSGGFVVVVRISVVVC